MRAAHLVHDPPPWILEDRLARSVVGEEFFAAAEAAVTAWPPDVFAGFRAHFTVRARLAEDVAVEGLDELRNDYVLLGAGADTFAWRHPHAAAFTIWEVDHPASQAWKREALGRANLPVPPNVRFVAVDLGAVPVREVELPSRATWNWLGVTQYLDKPVTESVLRAIAGQDSGTTAVVEFLLTEAECDELGAAFRAHGIAVAGQSSEPMVSFYEPIVIERLLRRCGFGTIDLLETDTLHDRYLPPHGSASAYLALRSSRPRGSDITPISADLALRARQPEECRVGWMAGDGRLAGGAWVGETRCYKAARAVCHLTQGGSMDRSLRLWIRTSSRSHVWRCTLVSWLRQHVSCLPAIFTVTTPRP
jgi:methyltransferase (TIGR00027 family)